MAIFSNQATLTYNGGSTNSNIAYGEILDVLTLKEYDSVWDCACKLAIAHERRGFYAGVRMGLRLREELREGDAAPR